MSNFSRETFDELKRYVSVRLQQGVPLVDADWNELQDIRKHELEEFLRLFVGDGVPMGDDGFAIGSVTDGNDFSIAAGHCLVKGWCVVNESTVRYTEQTDAPPLKPPASGERIDKVYLDVWEREVDSEENPDLVNPDIGIETCVRIRREWRVRVAEGATSLPAPPAGHVFYPLATLNRKAGQDGIGTDSIIDLRRTGLNLASLRIYVDTEGNVGIGTKAPEAKLTVNDPIDTSSIPDLGFGRANVHALSAQSDYGGRSNEVLAMFRSKDGDGFSDVLLQHKYIGESPGRAISVWGGNLGKPEETREVHYVGGGGEGYFAGNVGIGTAQPRTKLDVDGYGSFASHVNLWTDDERDWQVGNIGGIPAHDFGIADEVNNTGPARMVIQRGTGNVGIGTASPRLKLEVAGTTKTKALVIESESNGIGFVRRLSVFSYNHPGPYEPGHEHDQVFFHIRTPNTNQIVEMWRYDLRGYAYGAVVPLDLVWVGYYYNGNFVDDLALCQSVTREAAPYLEVSQYTGSDSHLYLKFGPINHYYLNFTLDYQCGRTGEAVVKDEQGFTVQENADGKEF